MTTTNSPLPAPESKFAAGRDVRDIAKDLRKDIAAAVKSGLLPKGLKCSVRIERYAGGRSIDITVTAAPGVCFLSTRRIRFEIETNGRVFTPMSRYSTEGARVIKTLEAFHASYNRDRSDLMSDYFDVAFYGGASFCHALDSALRAEIESAIKATEAA
jgi:hypothetical protein